MEEQEYHLFAFRTPQGEGGMRDYHGSFMSPQIAYRYMVEQVQIDFAEIRAHLVIIEKGRLRIYATFVRQAWDVEDMQKVNYSWWVEEGSDIHLDSLILKPAPSDAKGED